MTVETMILELLAEQDAAWAAGDADAFSARVTEDVIFTNIVGMFSVGKPGFVAQHAHIFDTFYRDTRLNQRLAHWKVLAPEVVVAECLASVSGVTEGPPGIEPHDGTLYYRPQQVLTRSQGQWQVAAFHNVVLRPEFLPKE